jgi:hypothetical protein
MGVGLSQFARDFLTNAEQAKRKLTTPILLWEAPPDAPREGLILGTGAGAPMARPKAGEPLVFPVQKNKSRPNPFAMGITIGRTEANDIVIDDESVSRFHCYLRKEGNAWTLVDAESKNGTSVGALKLEPNKPCLLTDTAKLKVGNILLLFLSPDAFWENVKGRLK